MPDEAGRLQRPLQLRFRVGESGKPADALSHLQKALKEAADSTEA
jgi:hypothetical protein